MKKNYFLLLFLLSSLITFSLNAQVSPQWRSYYRGNGDNEDRFHKIISDGAGNLICVGYTVKSGNHKDILTAKINTNGDTLWWKTKNGKGNGDDVGISVGVDASGNVYVAGTVDGGNSQNDIMVIKYDANGVTQWDTTWNNQTAFFDDVAVDMKVDAAGNSYVGGNTEPDTFAGSNDWVTMKFATDGSLQWVDIFIGSVAHGKDELASLAIDGSGNAYVTGRTEAPANDNIYTIKYDGNNGTRLWQVPYNGGANDRGESIFVDNLGFTYVTGRDDNGSSYDIRTIKYSNDNSGSIRWTRLFDSAIGEDDKPVKIVVDNNYNVIIAGYSDWDGTTGVDNDFLILKYDSTGNNPANVHIGSPYSKDDEPNDIVVDNSGNIYVTGKADQNAFPGSTDYDIMTVKYNASFNAQWNGPVFHSGTFAGGDDYGMSLIFFNDSVYVAGGTRNNGTQKDATIISYNISTGNENWFKDYNGSGDFSESARSIVVDGSNNSYITGYTYGEGENLDGFISKIDPSGTLICTLIYNGLKNDDDELNQIAIYGNYVYACGYTKVSNEKSNMLLIKWDTNICDSAVWTRTYDYIKQSDKAESLVVDASGNIYVTGRSDSDPNDTLNNEDIVTIAYNSSGGTIWPSPRRYDGSSHLKDEPVKIILDNAGNVIVGGKTENVHDDIIILKYQASDGTPVAGFPVIYDSQFTNDDRLNDITVDANNKIFVAGYAQTGPSPATDDPIIMSYDQAGVPAGFYSFSGNGHDEASRVIVDASGDIFVLYKYDTQPGLVTNSYSLLLKKFDSLLSQELWPAGTAQYDSPINNDVVPADLKLDSHGNVFATATVDNNINGSGAVNRNWITLGYATSGNNIFASNEDGPDTTDDSPNALIIKGDSMWVCGYTGGIGNNQKDATVYNYSILGVGIKNPALVSSNVYPNPFVNECVISVSDAVSMKDMVLSVYDMIGNLVTTPIQFSGNIVHLQKGKLSSGIYEYTITDDGNSIARGKLVVE